MLGHQIPVRTSQAKNGGAYLVDDNRLGVREDGGASLADDNCLGVREDCGDGEAAGALKVHEERPEGGHESLEPCPC